MDTVLSVLSSVFWGLLMLSVLVFLHEGGHFLAARACGVRVTEFFLGLPCRFDIHYTSRRIGTKFGVTPLLLGGYAAICGMDPTDVSCADRVLAAIYRHGRVTVADLAVELELSEEDVLEACALLLGWGSIAPWYEEGEKPSPSYYPTKYQTLPRDTAGYTPLMVAVSIANMRLPRAMCGSCRAARPSSFRKNARTPILAKAFSSAPLCCSQALSSIS